MGKEHWIETTLGQIATHPQYGWTTKAGRTGKYKYFRTTDIDSIINWGSVPYCVQIPQNPDDYTIRKNDILVSRAGSIGYNIRFDEDHLDTLFASYLIRFRPINPIDSKFISYYLQTKVYWSFINESQSGIAVPNVNATKLSELPFPLPPFGEQKRIVEKLDDILPNVRSVKARLEKIPIILKKFRQSVLAAACSGRLTEDWREGKDLPEWEDAELSTIAQIIDPNPSHRYPSYVKGSVPILATEQFDGINGWDITSAKCVNKAFYEERVQRHGFHDDDIIFARKGRLGLARRPPKIPQYVFSHTLFIIRTNPTLQSDYLLWFLRQESIVSWLIAEMNSNTGVPTLGKGILEKLPVTIPPLTEQEEIVLRIEKLFVLADSIEEKYNKAMGRVDNIEQSVLAKAFRGELVAPDPNDEPADALLARILEEKGKIEDEGRSRKARKRKG